MTENKKSNRFTLKNYIAIRTFNAKSDHNITIEINNKVFYKNDLAKIKSIILKFLTILIMKNLEKIPYRLIGLESKNVRISL